MATIPENSDHTCVKQRIEALSKNENEPRTLETFVGSSPELNGLPFLLKDYIELVDWSGRIIRDDKRGAIKNSLPPILERLSLNQDAWKVLTTQFEQTFKHWVGSDQIVQQAYSNHQYQRKPKSNHLLG